MKNANLKLESEGPKRRLYPLDVLPITYGAYESMSRSGACC